jgi:hypothetical protein
MELDAGLLAARAWPAGVDFPHGVLLCYDAGSNASFAAVRGLLSAPALPRRAPPG